MASSVGIVICNYNKIDYLIPCIESVLASEYNDFDIYVADNASTDGSPEKVREVFGSRVKLVVNRENKGGAGGFNAGVRAAMKAGHAFLLLLDNDTLLFEDTIGKLVDAMKSDSKIAIAGAAIYKMDEPEESQEIGALIDFDLLDVKPLYRNTLKPTNVPAIVDCEYVPACCMLVRADAIAKHGIMFERYFIYWDDMEWGYRFIQNGYRVVAVSDAKMLHKTGGSLHTNTFWYYYFYRNRVHFFTKYLDVDRLDEVAALMIDAWFREAYWNGKQGIHSIGQTLYMAFADVLDNKLGQAGDNRILVRETKHLDLKNAHTLGKRKLTAVSDNNPDLYNTYRGFARFCKDQGFEFRLVQAGKGEAPDKLQQLAAQAEQDELIFYFTDYVMNTPDNIRDVLVVDNLLNFVDLQSDAEAISRAKEAFAQLNAAAGPLITERLKALKPLLLEERIENGLGSSSSGASGGNESTAASESGEVTGNAPSLTTELKVGFKEDDYKSLFS